MNRPHPLVDAYLDRLETLLGEADPATRSEVMAGIREHLDGRLEPGAGEADIRRALRELGTPEEVSDEAYAAAPGVARDWTMTGPSTRSGDRRWLPAAVTVLGILALTGQILLFGLSVASPGLSPYAVEVALSLVVPPFWPVLAILVLAARGWTKREKTTLIVLNPLATVVGMTLIYLFGRLIGPIWPVFAVIMLAIDTAVVWLFIRLGRRGLARSR